MSWNDELRAECKRLFIIEGISATETADRLNRSEAGRKVGAAFSRNAVIGISFRSGWARSPEIARQNAARPAQGAARPRPAPKPPRVDIGSGHMRTPPAPAPRARPGATAFDVTPTAKPWTERVFGECRWPVGEPAAPADQLSCCAPADGPYCPSHTAWGGRKYGGAGAKPATAADLERLFRRVA